MEEPSEVIREDMEEPSEVIIEDMEEPSEVIREDMEEPSDAIGANQAHSGAISANQAHSGAIGANQAHSGALRRCLLQSIVISVSSMTIKLIKAVLELHPHRSSAFSSSVSSPACCLRLSSAIRDLTALASFSAASASALDTCPYVAVNGNQRPLITVRTRHGTRRTQCPSAAHLASLGRLLHRLQLGLPLSICLHLTILLPIEEGPPICVAQIWIHQLTWQLAAISGN